MAILNRIRMRPATRVALAAMCLSGAGCVLLSRFSTRDRPLAFSHAIHVQQGMDCTDCHAGAEESDDPGMPAQGQCLLCHKDLDAKKPPERRSSVLFTDGKLQVHHAARVPDEVIFSHKAHVARGLDCSACHPGIQTSERIGTEMRISMDACTRCHERTQPPGAGPQDCAVCHKEIKKDVSPPSHEHNWRKMHGQSVRAGGEGMSDRCSLCHTESTCTACHSETAPESHNAFWRTRGHGIAAEMDRGSCAACHRPDSCQRCHADTLPASHTGMWGSPRDNHCLTCHFPLTGESCAVCHRSAPSHALAAPMPSWHTPGMNCRQCHGVTQPLPHVDNGSTCTMCHH
jgi:hypothetical protein